MNEKDAGEERATYICTTVYAITSAYAFFLLIFFFSSQVHGDKDVLLVQIFHGQKKPPLEVYERFVNDMIGLQARFAIEIVCHCDFPARAHWFGHTGHTAYCACPYCEVRGVRDSSGVMTFRSGECKANCNVFLLGIPHGPLYEVYTLDPPNEEWRDSEFEVKSVFSVIPSTQFFFFPDYAFQ